MSQADSAIVCSPLFTFYYILTFELENKMSFKKSAIFFFSNLAYTSHIVASTSPSCFEAHADLFRLLMKGIFDPYALDLLTFFFN